DHPNTRLQADRINGKMVVLSVNGRPTTEPDLVGRFTLTESGRIIEHGEADALLRNDGGGKFTPVSFTAGAFVDEDGQPLKEPPYDWGLTAMFRDINRDGAPDIYVCNDFESVDRIWINDGHGRFRALPRLALRHTSMSSMGVDFADINRDGFDDIFVADMMAREHGLRQRLLGARHALAPSGVMNFRMQYMRNMLFLNRGDGTYAEIAQLSGVEASDW